MRLVAAAAVAAAAAANSTRFVVVHTRFRADSFDGRGR